MNASAIARAAILESAFTAAAASALRNRAEVFRRHAEAGVTVLDREPPVRLVEPKAARLLRIARDWDGIAKELENEEATP